MKTTTRGLLLLGSVLVLAAGCHRAVELGLGDAGTDSDTDTDGDTDSGTGTDGDTDSATATDTGTGDCESATIDLPHAAASALVLLDRSVSMTSNSIGPVTFAEVAANFVRFAAQWFDEGDRVNLGLAVFPSPSCPDGVVGSPNECAPASSDSNPVVEVAPDNFDDLDLALDIAGTCGGTPLCHSLVWARGHLTGSDFPAGLADRPKTVLVITDGAPNCNPDLDPQTCTCTSGPCVDPKQCLDDACAGNAASQLAAAEIPVFVAVVGDEGFEWGEVMDAIAAAGGTSAYYPIGEPQQDQGAVLDIDGRVTPCWFGVDWSAVPDGPEKGCHALTVEAEIDGVWEELPRSPNCNFSDGWRWVGEPPAYDETTDYETLCTRIELCSWSCELYKTQALQQVRGRLDCLE